MRLGPQISPLRPVFRERKRFGSVEIGNTPPGTPPTPGPVLPPFENLVYVATGDVATTPTLTNCEIYRIGTDRLLLRKENGDGLALIDISDRENPALITTAHTGGAGVEIVYSPGWVDPSWSSFYIPVFTYSGSLYRIFGISTSDLSDVDVFLDSDFTGWSGTNPNLATPWLNDPQNVNRAFGGGSGGNSTQNYVDPTIRASLGAVGSGGVYGDSVNTPGTWIPELGLVLGKLGGGTGAPQLIDIDSPLSPSAVTTLAVSGSGNVSSQRHAYVSPTELAVRYYRSGERLGLFDVATGTELDLITTANVVDNSGNIQSYTAQGRTWVVTPGNTISGNRRISWTEIVSGAFGTPTTLALPAGRQISRFIIVDNYLYSSSSSTGQPTLVTYRIEAL